MIKCECDHNLVGGHTKVLLWQIPKINKPGAHEKIASTSSFSWAPDK